MWWIINMRPQEFWKRNRNLGSENVEMENDFKQMKKTLLCFSDLSLSTLVAEVCLQLAAKPTFACSCVVGLGLSNNTLQLWRHTGVYLAAGVSFYMLSSSFLLVLKHLVKYRRRWKEKIRQTVSWMDEFIWLVTSVCLHVFLISLRLSLFFLFKSCSCLQYVIIKASVPVIPSVSLKRYKISEKGKR